MAVPAGTYKARFSFRLGSSGEEEAVIGFHLRNADAASQATTDALCTHVDNAWTAHADPLKAFMASQTHLVETAVYALDGTNHTVTASKIAHPTSGTGSWSGTATNSLPWECAPLVSLHAYSTGAFVAQAARRRGRMYFPPFPASAITNQDGAINNTDVDTYQAAVQAILEAVNDIPTGLSSQARVVILSLGGKDGLSAAAVHDVQDVVMGSTIHSQRRRERSQAVNHVKIGTLTP